MGRSGYGDSWELETWDLIRWRGAVKSAIRGKRGQAFLRELRDALDAMPEKELISGALKTTDGQVCALGCVGMARGVEMPEVDIDDFDDDLDPPDMGHIFGIPRAMAAEIMYENDEAFYGNSPAGRWQHMRKWVERNIKG